MTIFQILQIIFLLLMTAMVLYAVNRINKSTDERAKHL